MKIIDITKTDNIDESIKILIKNKADNQIEKLKKQFDVYGHDVFDKSKRKDKEIKDDKGVVERQESVNRIGLSIQKRIVNSAVNFTFGKPVQYTCNSTDTSEIELLSSFKNVLKDNKIETFDREIAKALFKSTEVAEIWYLVPLDEANEKYGFNSKFRIKVVKVCEWDGDLLFPIFDTTGNLICFSRKYVIKNEEGKSIEFLDVFTDEEIVNYQKSDNGWIELTRVENLIKKIPVIYAKQENSEWHDVQSAIDRLEILLSNFADTDDYHAAPKIFVQGGLSGFSQKGESGAILIGENGATAEYLSWNHATDAVKLEIETLFKIIYSQTQTPDISFDNLKDLNQISGVALKMLFMDAHLKVMDKKTIFDSYIQRRINVVLAFLAQINTKLAKTIQKIDIKHEIIPYMIEDQKANIDLLISANNGKPLVSQKTSISLAGLVNDVDTEWEQIQKEETQANQEAIGSTVI